jgi:hypothetical protein
MGVSGIEYDDLIKGQGKSLVQQKTIRTHVPSPTYNDFRRGYIVRYFIQQINDNNATIYEINENDYKNFTSDVFYNAVKIDWRLTGNLENIKLSNEKSVKLGSKKMKALLFYLPNYLQFSGY